MKNYLEKTLHLNIKVEETNDLKDKLPLFFSGRYDFLKVETNGLIWLALKAKDNVGLNALKKDYLRIRSCTKLNCAFFLEKTSFYIKEKLLENGIPFVIENKQVYLPFMGIVFNNDLRSIKPVNTISFLTQKVVLMAIYEGWKDENATSIAKILNVTKMSISRCFDEIEYSGIDILTKNGKSRVIKVPNDIKELWGDIKPKLRNPIISSYKLSTDLKLNCLAGISALSELSMLSDNRYPTYAITKKEISKVNIRNIKQVEAGEEIGCLVYEIGYFINYQNKNIQDPFSILLSLTDEEKEDERVIMCVEEMLKEYVW